MMKKKKEFTAAGAHNSVVYERPQWKHYLRWICFLIVVSLDSLLIISVISFHTSNPGSWTSLPRELLGLSVVGFLNLVTLPSIVFEANRVEVTPDKLILANLLYTTKLKWTDITGFYAPRALKFSILKTTRFFHLLNKRDLERYDELVQTIEHKTHKESD